jgi:hypothetical protein
MSDKKSSLEEARLNYQEIQKFAEEQAAEKLKEQVSETLQKLFTEKLNEDTTINIDGSGNVAISTDGEVVDGIGTDAGAGSEMELGADAEMGLDSPENDSEEFMVSDEDDEIKIDETIQNMEEMNDMTMEQEQAAAMPAPTPAPTGAVAPEAGAAPVAETPVEAAPAMPDLLAKLDTLINIMMQQQGGATPEGAEGGQEFEVIDDEAGAAGAPAPGVEVAPAMAPPAMEEEIDIIGFEDENPNPMDEMEEQMLEIVDEDDATMEGGPAMEETRSLGFTSKRTGDKQLKMDTMEKNKGHHAPVTSLKESNKNKAQDESKLDELIKENKGLKNTVKSLQNERKEFEDAFTDLRTQFDNMQLFNGKLALVNKVLMNGGLTTEEKIRVCEQFDSVKTHEEATKLFKSIIKENNIKVVDGKEKLKSTSTNTAKPKSTTEPLYESDEARRAKKLAGITKTEDGE